MKTVIKIVGTLAFGFACGYVGYKIGADSDEFPDWESEFEPSCGNCFNDYDCDECDCDCDGEFE